MILVVATDINDLFNTLQLTYTNVTPVYNLRYGTAYTVTINNQEVMFLNSGITKVNLSTVLTNIINNYDITNIITYGNIACLNKCIRTGDIVIGTSALQYDVNFSYLNYEEAFIPDVNMKTFNFDNDLITKASQIVPLLNLNYYTGVIGSADIFLASNSISCELINTLKIDYVDTESGTIGELSYIYSIPSIVIKGISNYADNCAEYDYKLNKQIASSNAFNVVKNLLNSLTL